MKLGFCLTAATAGLWRVYRALLAPADLTQVGGLAARHWARPCNMAWRQYLQCQAFSCRPQGYEPAWAAAFCPAMLAELWGCPKPPAHARDSPAGWVWVPETFRDLHPIKKLPFKPSSCFGACPEESIARSVVLACDKSFSFLLCTDHVLFMLSSWFWFPGNSCCVWWPGELPKNLDGSSTAARAIKTGRFPFRAAKSHGGRFHCRGRLRLQGVLSSARLLSLCKTWQQLPGACEGRNRTRSRAAPCCKAPPSAFALSGLLGSRVSVSAGRCPAGISLALEGKLLRYAGPWWHRLGLKLLRGRLERRLSRSSCVPGGRN